MRLSHLVASAHLKRRLLHRNTSLTIHQAASNSLYSNCISVESSNNHVRRHFSGTNKDQNGTNDLKETLNKINDEYEETKGSEDKNIPKQTNVNEDSYQPSTPSSFSFISSTISYVTENISEAFKELVGTNETNTLRRQVSQPAYKPKKTGEDEEEVIEYTGPKELVAVKEALSPWDQMKARLQDSPLIREILKSSKKIGDVAAKTEIGKKVKDMNEQVKDKIEDVREYLETSQDPITYTLTGVWENLTGESEEAIATSAIKKLDPNFVKVRSHLFYGYSIPYCRFLITNSDGIITGTVGRGSETSVGSTGHQSSFNWKYKGVEGMAGGSRV